MFLARLPSKRCSINIMDKKRIIKITKNLPHIIGVAPNAFSRVVPSEYFPNYSIVCFKYRKETDIISKDIEVFCAEKADPEAFVYQMNAGEILKLESVKSFINSKNNPHLLIYKPTKGAETAAHRMGWKLIGNSATVKYEIENKLSFRNLLDIAGIESIKGETVPFAQLTEEVYKRVYEKYGGKLVFQICEMTTGGGTGTAFINNIDDYRAFMDKFTLKKQKLSAIENVNITKFIEGVPTSIAACTTKSGVLTGRIQTQILDISETRDTSEGSGLFCGHDFAFGNYDDNLNSQAKEFAIKFGEYIYNNLGYKGIFGLDLITNVKEGNVYPVECNPRYTDAFPVLSEIHNSNGAVPMDVFHIFEHMGVDYEINVDEISKQYSQKTPASQIILETKSNDWKKVTGDIKAGIYKLKAQEQLSNSISYSRPGYRFEHLQSENEFLITEGVPFKDTVFKGGSRILRLMFPKSILKSSHELTDNAKDIIKNVYKLLSLKTSSAKVAVKDFFGLKICDIENKDDYIRAQKLSPDMVNLITEDKDFGLLRPQKIGWGMDISKRDPLTFIKSKKMRKHLKNWLLNMDIYGLSYEIIETLTVKEYTQWFDKYYELLSSKEKANIKINPQWLVYKKKMGKKAGGVFLYKDKKFIGGNIFICDDKSFTVGYGIVERLKSPNWSLGALADFLSLKTAQEMGYKRIGFGQDNNLYGHHLSVGLLQYKLNFGLEPWYKDTGIIYSTKFPDIDKLDLPLIFLGIKNKENVFYILQKKGNEEIKLNTNIQIINI